jgi:pilus assembly protein CpaC
VPPVPEAAPRPAEGPKSIASFIDSLTTHDAGFEVVVGQARILTTKEDIAAPGKPAALVAVGDPSVINVNVLNSRQVRVYGHRIGVSDLSITTSDNRTYSFDIRVVADLDVLRAQLHAVFPDAALKVAQIRDAIVVEGQARDTAQVQSILAAIRGYLTSLTAAQSTRIRPTGGAPTRPMPAATSPLGETPPPPVPAGVPVPVLGPEAVQGLSTELTVPIPQIINLIRVPGSQQVLLKVRVAELNRTAMREIGADWLIRDRDTGTIAGTQIGGTFIHANGTIGDADRGGIISQATTLFGIFEPSEFQFFLSALRKNNLLRILAEPDLVALNGHQANFLAGGEFPVPVTQGGGGAVPTVTVQFQPFGVQLAFVPFILDGDVIRLTVDPSVSSIDFTLGTVLVPGGTPVPGLDVRNAHTVVEMRPGQTLAIAGLLQLTLDGNTNRIPGLGDLPILGPFFSNTTGDRIEKELVVLVTPYLVEPMNADQKVPTPGDDVKTPTDFEFYLLNRIEGHTATDFRATTDYDWAQDMLRCYLKMHQDHVYGPQGFSDGIPGPR